MHAARFGKSAASLEQGPQGRPLCFIQPCCTSNLPAGLANYLESTEIARRHLQTVSEPAASASSGSEPVQKGRPAELSKAREHMVPHCLGALQAVRSSRGLLLAPQHGQPQARRTVSAHHGTWSVMDASSYHQLLPVAELLSPAQRCGYPFVDSPFPFHGSFSHFPANQNSETFESQIILTISG